MNFCCKLMETNVTDLMTVDYYPVFNEYGIIIPGDKSIMTLKYCPWCGKKLPDSMRLRWFEELEKLGYDEPFDQDIPEIYRDDRWYNK